MKMKRLACKEGICKRTVEEIGVKQGTDLRRPADIKIVMVKRPVTVPFLVATDFAWRGMKRSLRISFHYIRVRLSMTPNK